VRIRFLADADFRPRIIVGFKRLEPEIDFETANEAGLKGLPDSEVLRMAAEKGRVLVSHDRKTMPRAFYRFLQERESPGVILIEQNFPIGQAIEELRLCYHALEAEELINRLIHLPL
jgi:Domain of unknown function (DUF5615)